MGKILSVLFYLKVKSNFDFKINFQLFKKQKKKLKNDKNLKCQLELLSIIHPNFRNFKCIKCSESIKLIKLLQIDVKHLGSKIKILTIHKIM